MKDQDQILGDIEAVLSGKKEHELLPYEKVDARFDLLFGRWLGRRVVRILLRICIGLGHPSWLHDPLWGKKRER